MARRGSIIDRLTRTFVIGLLLLAALAVVAFLQLRAGLLSGRTDAEVINVSGRQRMLLKHSMLLVHRLHLARAEPERRSLRRQLSQTANQMESFWRTIRRGDPARGLPAPPAAVKRLLLEPTGVWSVGHAWLRALRDLAASRRPVPRSAVDRLMERHAVLMPLIDRQVALHQRVSENRLRSVLAGATLVVCAQLLALVLVGLLLFRPMVRRVARADRLRNEFISTVSHELRTPLTSIRGSLSLLESGAVDAPERVAELLSIGRRNAERLFRLINNMLDLGRGEVGALTLQPEQVDVPELADDALTGVRALADTAGVSLSATLERDLELYCDRERVIQVLVNLLGNAIKYSPRGGWVELAARRQGPAIRFTVTDQGPGVADRDRRRIFEKFEQADASDRRARGGAGLGLAICKQIVSAHRGTIGVRRGPKGLGSEFYFMIDGHSDPVSVAPPSRR